jgi:hypothetical protein
MNDITLQDFIASKQNNAWTTYHCNTGSLAVYARKNIFNRNIIEIANIASIEGFGSCFSLYKHFLNNIPAIAENIHNPELDKWLDKLKWYGYDSYGVPTRINPYMMKLYPNYMNYKNVTELLIFERITI